ncbi:MAG: DUF4860 domain-containing protein [Lachnospiraceae bacterium]|jgi:hypothetical protein|nr:DUF4860 domain-containing protein [Lachnospiraceae bacterium]
MEEIAVKQSAPKRNTGNHGQLINVLFTMLLFLVFVLCALFTVLIGGQVYENINVRSQENFTGSVALQYVANKVRQGDQEGAVHVITVEDTPVLEIKSGLGNYVSWIYFRDGSICELFFDPADGLGLADGLSILTCDGFTPSQSEDGRIIRLQTEGMGGTSISLALRCEEKEGIQPGSKTLQQEEEPKQKDTQTGGSGNE